MTGQAAGEDISPHHLSVKTTLEGEPGSEDRPLSRSGVTGSAGFSWVFRILDDEQDGFL